MGQINTLINEHLVPECYCEREMFSGDMPRQFFIEIFNSCDKSTLDEMLDKMIPKDSYIEMLGETTKEGTVEVKDGSIVFEDYAVDGEVTYDAAAGTITLPGLDSSTENLVFKRPVA